MVFNSLRCVFGLHGATRLSAIDSNSCHVLRKVLHSAIERIVRRTLHGLVCNVSRVIAYAFMNATMCHQPVNGRQKCRQRLTRPGRRNHQYIAARADHGPRLLLHCSRFAECMLEPRPGRRREEVQAFVHMFDYGRAWRLRADHATRLALSHGRLAIPLDALYGAAAHAS